MATVVDPDDLTLSANPRGSSPDGSVYIVPNSSPPTIQLISNDESGGFVGSTFTSKQGVTLQALYSFLKQQWKDDPGTNNWINYLFPMEAITAEQFEFINNWEPADDATRRMIRTGGWTEKDSAGTEKQSWLGVITLGSIGALQQPYFAWYDVGGASFLTNETDFEFTGVVNEPVQIFGDTNNGNFDYREKQLFIYIRPAPTGPGGGTVTGYTFDFSSTDEIGSGSSVTTQVYRFPLTTTVDLNITLIDSEVVSLISSDGLQIRFDQSPFSSSNLPLELSGGPYTFTHVIESTNGDVQALTPSEVYNFVQYSLRQPNATDIDAGSGTRNGSLTEELVRFVGSTLETFAINGGTEGVVVDNFSTDQTSNFAFRDNTNNLRVFPVISSGTITFNSRLVEDPASRYWMFFQNANSGANIHPGNTALIVTEQDGSDITGYLHIQAAATASETQNGSSTGGNITAGSSVLTSATGGLTPSALVGQVLRITAGNNLGFWFITANTANTITIDGTFEETDAAFTVTWAVYPKNTTGEVGYTFDYDNAASNRGDGDPGNDAPITIVTLGLENAQYITQNGTIGSGSGQNFSVNAPLERNYSDPV